MKKQKIVENYFDSKVYSNQELLQNIEETKNEYSKKIVEVDIRLNEFGVYVVTYYFKNRDNIFKKIFIKIKKKARKNKIILLQDKSYRYEKMKTREERKNEKIRKRMKKYSESTYGLYKKTKTYKPY